MAEINRPSSSTGAAQEVLTTEIDISADLGIREDRCSCSPNIYGIDWPTLTPGSPEARASLERRQGIEKAVQAARESQARHDALAAAAEATATILAALDDSPTPGLLVRLVEAARHLGLTEADAREIVERVCRAVVT